jgi:hypothetical protein
LYAVWSHDDQVQFRRSLIAGESRPEASVWEPPIGDPATVLSLGSERSRSPVIDASGSEVYVTWESRATDPEEVFFRRSLERGGSFGLQRNLSANAGHSLSPALSAAGSDLYVAWSDDTAQPVFSDVLLRGSSDEGETFTGCLLADLAVELHTDLTSAAPGDLIGATVNVRNKSCGVLLARVTMPIVVGVTRFRWCRGEGCLPVASGGVHDVISLPPGESVVYEVEAIVAPDFLGTLALSASAVPHAGQIDDDSADNVAEVHIEVRPRPGIAAFCRASTALVLEGDSVTLTLVALNGGPRDQGDNPGPELTYSVPAGLDFVSASADSGTVSTAPPVVTWDGAIAAGGRVIVQVTATVSAGTAGTVLCSQATVFFDADGDGANESMVLSDDAERPGVADACCIRVLTLEEIPVLSQAALALLALVLLLLGLHRMGRGRRD